MGDPNASIPTPQPTFYRPQFGAAGRAIGSTCLTFVSQAALAHGRPGSAAACVAGWSRAHAAAASASATWCATHALPRIEVDPETYTVKADGVHLTCEPARGPADGPAVFSVLRCAGAAGRYVWFHHAAR
jgi:urease subunit alpha